jgi:hypothetical protein
MTPFELALRQLSASNWTALNVLCGSEDWTCEKDIEHMQTCPLTAKYKDLSEAVGNVLSEWKKIKDQLNDEAFEHFLKRNEKPS